MARMVFRKQKFECGGCGKVMTGKMTVPVERVRQMMNPPVGWYTADFDTQDKNTGAIAVLRIFSCSEACATKAAAVEGKSATLIKSFQSLVGRPDLTDEAIAATPVIDAAVKPTDAPDLAQIVTE